MQGELERMLARLAGDVPVTVVGAGRTDSGVHAHGQAAHADIATRYGDSELLHALRRMSPADIAITELRGVPAGFHARYSACARSYRYRIHHSPDPFAARYSWYLDRQLDVALLNAAAEGLVGIHDYTALSKHNPDTPNMLCNVATAAWHAGPGGLEFAITADRFLYGMVRLVVGMQVDVALGRRPMQDIGLVLASRNRAGQSAMAPAAGLSLVDVAYPHEYEFGTEIMAS